MSSNETNDGIVLDVQRMMADLMHNAIGGIQKSESAVPGEEAADAVPSNIGIADIKKIVVVVQKFIDNINAMITKLEGGATQLNRNDDKFMDDYMATADNILEMAAFSARDSLTGLSNRHGFDNRIILEWNKAAREKLPVNLLLFCVDGFSYQDESLDWEYKDELLRAVSKTLGASLKRSTDFMARWSPDEFAVLLPITDVDGTMIVANRIRDDIGNLSITHTDTKITVSIGVHVHIPRKGELPAEFVSKAIYALDEAKNRGTNQIVLHQDD